MARGFSRSGRSSGGGGGFRAGFGGSGSSYRSSSSGGSPRGPRHPWRMRFFGRTIILAGPAQTLLSLLLGILIFGIVFMVGIFGNLSETKEFMAESEEIIQKYEEYDEVFDSIIKKANNGDTGYYIVNASFSERKYTTYGDDPTATGYYLTDYYEKAQYYYFIVYNFYYHEDDAIGQAKANPVWNDSTFIQYTFDSVKDLGGTLQIAYTHIDGEVWAINTSYTLEKNKDYALEKTYLEDLEEDKSIYTKMLIIDIVVLAVVIGIAALFIVKKYKQAKKDQAVKDAKNEAEIAEAQARVEIAEAKASQVGRKCQYCGADIPDGEQVCPACGSRHFEK